MSVLPLRKLVMVPDREDLRSSDEQFQAVSSAIPRLTRAPKAIYLEPPLRIEELMTQVQLAVVEPNELKTFETDEPKKKTKNKWVPLAISGWVALLHLIRFSSTIPGGKPGAARKRRESSPIVFISPGGFAYILSESETFLTLTQLDRDKARYHNSAQTFAGGVRRASV